MEQSFTDKVRDFRYDQQLSLVAFLSGKPESEERTAIAVGLVRELALRQVFDRFSKEQRATLLDALSRVASPDTEKQSTQPFGIGARTDLEEARKQGVLF